MSVSASPLLSNFSPASPSVSVLQTPGGRKSVPSGSPPSLSTASLADFPVNDGAAPHSPVKRFLPPHWDEDEDILQCNDCNKKFSLLIRKHHCRNCGGIYCADCTKNRLLLHEKHYQEPVRVCDRCYFSLSLQRRQAPPPSQVIASSSTISVTPLSPAMNATPVGSQRSGPRPVSSPPPPTPAFVTQLKSQLTAMEDVSSALMQENRELRTAIEKLEEIHVKQREVIAALQKDSETQRLQIASVTAAVAKLKLAESSTDQPSAPTPSSSSSSSSAAKAKEEAKKDTQALRSDEREQLQGQLSRLETELRELHVRTTDERDSLYNELIYTRSTMQMMEAELNNVVRENQELRSQLSVALTYQPNLMPIPSGLSMPIPSAGDRYSQASDGDSIAPRSLDSGAGDGHMRAMLGQNSPRSQLRTASPVPYSRISPQYATTRVQAFPAPTITDPADGQSRPRSASGRVYEDNFRRFAPPLRPVGDTGTPVDSGTPVAYDQQGLQTQPVPDVRSTLASFIMPPHIAQNASVNVIDPTRAESYLDAEDEPPHSYGSSSQNSV